MQQTANPLTTTSVWVETDLEPDDVLAIRLKPLCHANWYVVGEGNANTKYNRMKKYCQLLNNTSAIIIYGMNSSKPFPNDGKEFDVLPNDIPSNINYLDNFIALSKCKNPIMFSLKPMKELLHEFAKNKDLIKSLVKNIELYLYGSFNIRSILTEHKGNVIELLQNFKKVCIYESFYATGEQNSINKLNFPILYDFFQKK